MQCSVNGTRCHTNYQRVLKPNGWLPLAWLTWPSVLRLALVDVHTLWLTPLPVLLEWPCIQALDEAIARGLPRVEAGAQGQHKLQVRMQHLTFLSS